MKRSKDDSPLRSLRSGSDYRARIDQLYNWLLDGRELDRLERIVKEAKASAKSRKRKRGSVSQTPRTSSASQSGLTISSEDKDWLRPIREAKQEGHDQDHKDRAA